MTKKTTLRRCAGSARFGMEPHEAPTSDFPKQPSRKDGLGVMCTKHWKTYVKSLRKARIAADVLLVADLTTAKPKGKAAKPKATKTRAIAHDAKLRKAATPAKTRAKPRAKKATAKPSANAAEIAEAEKVIAEVDAMPADEAVKRVGDEDVQAALETAGASRGTREMEA